MNSVDDTRNYEQSIGFNIIDNTGYIIINILWISLEFKITGAQLYRRFKYGDNGWTEWVQF